MDLDSFLEKDITTYLENTVNFGIKDVEEGPDVADALLATKEEPTEPQAPPSPETKSESETPSDEHVSTEWFDELEKTATERRAELDKIVDLEDSINDVTYALDSHDVDKAKALYDHLLEETNAIKYHSQEKFFLLGELKKLSDRLSLEQEQQPAEEETPEDSALDDVSEDEPDKESSSPLLDQDGDLPPSFLKEETQAVFSYVAGVQALRNKDKTKALEIFLHLAKERPQNLAIKIRLQEAVELL